jgi:hypothetical protein
MLFQIFKLTHYNIISFKGETYEQIDMATSNGKAHTGQH